MRRVLGLFLFSLHAQHTPHLYLRDDSLFTIPPSGFNAYTVQETSFGFALGKFSKPFAYIFKVAEKGLSLYDFAVLLLIRA